MEYKIRFKREIWNTILHIVLGIVLAYVFIPQSQLLTIILFTTICGIFREALQYIRKKIQPLYIQIIDVFGFTVGGLLWFLIRTWFNINADIL